MEHQSKVHSFVTDVIGPSEPVHLLGTNVTDVVPMACTPGDIPVTFVALSYAGTLSVSVVVDPDAAADLAGLHDRFAADLSALVVAAGGRARVDTRGDHGVLQPTSSAVSPAA